MLGKVRTDQGGGMVRWMRLVGPAGLLFFFPSPDPSNIAPFSPSPIGRSEMHGSMDMRYLR